MANNRGPNVGYIRPEVKKEMSKWELVDDTVEGEEAVKAKGEQYLPKPETHSDPAINEKIYKKYKRRAVFFPVAGRTLAGLSGQVFSKSVITELPPEVAFMEENIDGKGTSLEQQSKEALGSVIKKGRGGLLSDFPRVEEGAVVTKADLENGKYRPMVHFYAPADVINWRYTTTNGETKLSLLVLYELKIVKDDGFEFKTEPRWRVYQLTPDGVTVTVWKLDDIKKANSTEAREYVVDEPETVVTGYNQQPLQVIPFSPIGSENNDMSVDDSPLYPLSVLNIAHYRNSADYEQSLFNIGQPMTIFTGLTDAWVEKHIDGKVTLGSITPVSLPQGADAKLLQASPNSLAKEGMDHKEDQMKAIGAKLIEPGTVQRTATESEIEEVSEASVLSNIAKNVSAAYKKAIYFCSLFIGEVKEDDISVSLNSEFQVTGLNAQEREEVVSAWQAGILTWEEVREVFRRKGIATETDEDAKQKIEAEGISGFGNASQEDNVDV